MVNPDQLRPMLFIGLAFVLFLIWQEWQQDYGPKPVPAQTVSSESSTPGEQPKVPADSTVGEVPVTPVASSSDTPAAAASVVPVTAEPAVGLVTVTTDLLRVQIDIAGGTLRTLDLLDFPASTDNPEEPFRLLNDQLPDLFMAQSGLLGDNAPNHTAVLKVERDNYVLADGADTLEVPMTWTSEDGVTVRKILVFSRGKYRFDVRYEVQNASAKPWTGRMYAQFKRTQVVQEGGIGFIHTYTGGVLNSPDKPYEKITFEDMVEADLKRQIDGGWVAMIQHYFAGAWIPDPTQSNYYYSQAKTAEPYLIGTMTPSQTVAPGASASFAMKGYVGPKIQGRMAEAADGLERTVDYGWLWMIAHPLFLGLGLIHSVLGNWGWSIIVLTLFIKLAFFHLSATSYKSMARMRKLTPKMTQLRERFGDDRQQLNQAMMQLYKTEKINPLSGCLPIVVQIPVFISLYWMLLESVELRHAPFMFWLNDLSTHDPLFVLPVLMGISMFIQQRLNPPPPDPMQAKVMMALPFVFTFFFLWFPSGLVLYWVVNNVLSIAQQWVITKRIEAAG